MKKSFFIVLPVSVGMLMLTMSAGWGVFLNIPSLLLSVFLSLLLCLNTFSPYEILGYFSIAFKKDTSDLRKIKNGIHFFSLLQSYLILSAIVSFVMGIIIILVHTTDPDAYFPGLAVALLVILYSLMVILVITTPFKSGLRRMQEEIE